MKYLVVLLISAFLLPVTTSGAHLKGGYIEYEYVGSTPGRANSTRFLITIYQYLDCNPPPDQIDKEVELGVFDAGTNQLVKVIVIPQSATTILKKSSFVCIDNPPTVCYRIDSYSAIADLDNNSSGYILALERCCRIAGIINVFGSSNTGIAYFTRIYPKPNSQGFIVNKSPVFELRDTALVCAKNGFTYPFKASDDEGDSLVYRFAPGVNSPVRDAKPNPPAPPPFPNLSYLTPFSASQPLGKSVTINANTGVISGIAPDKPGDYVVAVVVDEYRNGVKIAESRKELHVAVGSCTIPRAILPESITNCDNYVVKFENQSLASGINDYAWDFGVAGTNTDVSSLPQPSFTYPDTGVYRARLIVNPGGVCPDSMTTDVRIFPGFKADFTTEGVCSQLPYQFKDATKTTYGIVNKWHWDFGLTGIDTDVSNEQNPAFTYDVVNKYNITLIAYSNKGCVDTTVKTIDIADRPIVKLVYTDTLVCSKDALQLLATGTGVFKWTGPGPIQNPGISSPVVYPKTSGQYIVTLDNNSCITTDTVNVRVLDFITVNAGKDSTICIGDAIALNAITQGNKIQWAPANGLSGSTITNPVATVNSGNVTYTVTASLGSCVAQDAITITAAPYPVVNAGNDTAVCFGEPVMLSGRSNTPEVNWQPAASISQPKSLLTAAHPQVNTQYILSARFDNGCTKVAYDTVLVTVFPRINVTAPHDTTLVIGQPLVINATSNGAVFSWNPATHLSNANILSPTLQFNQADAAGLPDFIRYTVTATVSAGCKASDDFLVRIFKTGPMIFVPSGFTPNGDGKNDIIRPILAGMKQLLHFKVYNRFGQIMYETKTPGSGWNGTTNGSAAANGAYVYVCSATDFNGKPVIAKGSFVLIR